MTSTRTCPSCGTQIETYKNPFPAADVLVIRGDKVLLIERRNPPHGWAIPGGFIEYGEDAESAARRELNEETGLEASSLELLGVYSNPSRDPRFHTITVVYLGEAAGEPRAADDALSARWFALNELPAPLAFDHAQVIADAVNHLKLKT